MQNGITHELTTALRAVEATFGREHKALERLKAEIEFAAELAADAPQWQELLKQAVETVKKQLTDGSTAERAVAAAEEMLAPLRATAKTYTIHCIGHAHIDMNWMWNWPETVASTNDTFSTVDRLMAEFPTFKFSQSQTSVYQILKDYLPELYERVKARIAEGRWEITASQWVEGDRNMASGEILCRHLLYTRRFMKEEFGLPYDAVIIDWEPDTFGHAHTIPTILNKGGVRRYYLHRAGHGPKLFWWQGTDGSRVLAFDDYARGYNGRVNANIISGLFEFARATGMKDYPFVFGVGNHGGGPTRRDIVAALEMNEWPIFPNIIFSTTDAFYTAAEQAQNLPVIDREINYVFEGCYTSQSNIKRANRTGENALVEAEMCALLGRALAGLPYPADALFTGWKHTMLNQFHDILPGSGVKATYEHAQGLYQEVLAQTTMVKTRSLRAIAKQVNINAFCPCAGPATESGVGIGGGQGDIMRDAAVTRLSAGGACCDPFVIFNPHPWSRTEVITTRLWDRDYRDADIAVTDDTGASIPAQITERGNYWGHSYIGVAFPAREVPGLGYRSYCVNAIPAAPQATACTGNGKGVIENEFFKVEVEQASGAIVHLIDKRTGIDLVPAGERLGVLEYLLEAPHAMTAWILGQVVKRVPFLDGATISCVQNGPYLASVQTRHKFNDSTFNLSISLAAGVPRVDFTLEVDWLERGAPEIGVPALKIAFPLAVTDTRATFECPNGSVTRPTDPREVVSFTPLNSYSPGNPGIELQPAEVPAQKWADLTGVHADTNEAVGATLLNDTKYGYGVDGNTMRLTLLRSSYDPDPLPELGKHTIRFALQPHVGDWSASDATRAGYAFNQPLNVINTVPGEGTLPPSQGFAELLTPNVMLSGMKKAEDSDALIVRLYEMEGQATTARLRLSTVLASPTAPAVETDVMEQPLPQNTAVMKNSILEVAIPAYSLVTVKIG